MGIKISDLPLTTEISSDDYIPITDTGPLVTKRITHGNLMTVLATGTDLPRSLANRFAEVFNVEDYIGSDTIKIQSAITASASTGGGLVLLGNREYTVTSGFTGFGNDVTILGIGKSRIKKAFNGDLFTTGPAGRLKFVDVNIDADGNNYTGKVLVFSTNSSEIEWWGGRVANGPDSIFYFEVDGGNRSVISNVKSLGLSSTNLAAGAVVKNAGVDTQAMVRFWSQCATEAFTWFYKGTGMKGFYADHIYSAGFDFTGSTSLGCTLNSCRLAVGVGQVARMDGNNMLITNCLLGGDVTIQPTFINSRFIDNIMDNAAVFTCASPSITSEIQHAKTPLGYTATDTTPTVAGVRFLVVANAGPITITNLDDGIDQQEVTLNFSDANTTIQDGTNFQLSGGANFIGTANDTLTVIKFGTVWYEKCRSVN